MTMQSTLAQAGGSCKSRGETCRQLRPRQQIAVETSGRRAVRIPSSFHGLTIRETFLSEFGPVSVDWRKIPDNRRRGEQNTHSNSMYRCAQCVNSWSHFHHANARGSGLHIFVSQNGCHPRVMSRSSPRLTLTAVTRSLTLTSPVFPTFSPSYPSPLVHDPYLPCEDPRQSGGSTHIPISHTTVRAAAASQSFSSKGLDAVPAGGFQCRDSWSRVITDGRVLSAAAMA